MKAPVREIWQCLTKISAFTAPCHLREKAGEILLKCKITIMKKVILAIDGRHFPEAAFEFAKIMHRNEDILLTGVLLASEDFSQIPLMAGLEGTVLIARLLADHAGDDTIKANINRFSEACVKEGIEFRIHPDNSMEIIPALVKESRFADILLIEPGKFFNDTEEDEEGHYLESILRQAECSVVLVPGTFAEPHRNILAYDGSPSSAFAIKQFAYLFPERTAEETLLLFISTAREEKIPEYSLVSELASRHYPQLTIQNEVMFDKRDFPAWLSTQPVSCIIMGAYSKGFFSEIFRKSFAKALLYETDMPLFISHKL